MKKEKLHKAVQFNDELMEVLSYSIFEGRKLYDKSYDRALVILRALDDAGFTIQRKRGGKTNK